MSAPDPDRLVAAVADAHGLAWTPSGTASARSALDRARARAGERPEPRFHRLLADTETARSELVDALTVGESYFFRENAQIDFIRQRVLPDLLARRPVGHRLRIWSAGCAAGEEPYTLAMVVREQGLAARTTILGTDASPRRLAAARRGRYTSWALRSTPALSAAAYFQRQEDSFVLSSAIRDAVDFRLLNLAAETWPSAASGIGGFDLILCRNVLIYFTDPVVQSVSTRLLASLAPGGWLLLGAADPALRPDGDCETLATGAGLATRCHDPSTVRVTWPPLPFADRPIGIRAARPEEAPFVGPPPMPVPLPPSLAPDPPAPAPVATETVEAPPDATAAARVSSAEVRALLDAGRLLDAQAASEAAIRDHPLSPDLHHAHAIVLDDAGRLDEAVDAARRAVCLDPMFAVAHLTLGSGLARRGHDREARRALSRAVRLLAAMPPDARPLGAEGETAAALLGLARVHLARLTGRGRPR
jgi:chemotaxis protein methyltransferase CheR